MVTVIRKLSTNWQSFLRDDNKTELLNLLADTIVENCMENTVLVAKKDAALCNIFLALK